MFFKKRDKDFYIFVEDGAVKKEEKNKDYIKIIKDSDTNDNNTYDNNISDTDIYDNDIYDNDIYDNDIYDNDKFDSNDFDSDIYDNDIDLVNSNIDINSTEYAHYVTKKIVYKLKKEKKSNKTVVDCLEKTFNGKVSKINLERILKVLSFITICILTLESVSIVKDIVNKSKFEANLIEKTIMNSGDIEKDKENFEFLLNVIKTSNSNITMYYKEIKSFASAEDENTVFIYNRNISNCKTYIERDLNDISKLDDYINTKMYEDIINVLTKRYTLLVNLCDNLMSTPNDTHAKTYNTYASEEQILLDEIFELSILYLQAYNIPYTVDESRTIYW